MTWVAKSIRKYLHGNPLVTHWPPEYHRDFAAKWPPQDDEVNPHGSTRQSLICTTTHGVGRTERKDAPPARVETPKKVG